MKRYIILDALRGFALLGIALANFPEFSLYNFQPAEVQQAMDGASADYWCKALLLFFVDGKFYTIFSLLFGIGFSIILSNAKAKGADGQRVFYRRMIGLVTIGTMHLLLLWTGDILLLYALMGMLLPLFFRLSDRELLRSAVVVLLLPVVFDTVQWMANADPSQFAYDAWIAWRSTVGINDENFPVWLRDAQSYGDVLKFVVTAAPERLYEFIDSHRYFKVLGLFLVGAYIGRKRIYARLEELSQVLRSLLWRLLAVGLPLTILYTLIGMGGVSVCKPLHTLVYTLSVYAMGSAYCIILSLIYLRVPQSHLWPILAAPGRMALTNYLSHSISGIALFYGVGLSLGASISLAQTLAITLAVYATLCCLSAVWLRWFRYGPVEWLWRMWTYQKVLDIRAKA